MSGKVYFITGGNKGVGYELAKQTSEKSPDNTVLVAIRDVKNPSENLKKLAETHKNVKLIDLDVGSQTAIDSLDEQLNAVLPNGVVDVFLSNAGIGEAFAATKDSSDRENWIRHYEVNALGPVLIFQKLYPYLVKSSYKQAIFTSTGLASIGGYIPVPSGPYGQTKAAMNYSVKALSDELKSEGFIILSIHPGVVDTDIYRNSGFDVTAHKIKIYKAEESANLQLAHYENLTAEDNGTFWSIDGTFLPW